MIGLAEEIRNFASHKIVLCGVPDFLSKVRLRLILLKKPRMTAFYGNVRIIIIDQYVACWTPVLRRVELLCLPLSRFQQALLYENFSERTHQ